MGRPDRVMNAQKWAVSARAAQNIGKDKKGYVFYSFESEHDRFANVYYRIIFSTGVGYWFADSDELKMFAETSAGLEYANFYDSKSKSKPVMIPRGYIMKRLWENVYLSEDFFYISGVDGIVSIQDQVIDVFAREVEQFLLPAVQFYR